MMSQAAASGSIAYNFLRISSATCSRPRGTITRNADVLAVLQQAAFRQKAHGKAFAFEDLLPHLGEHQVRRLLVVNPHASPR